ncbi:MAG: hypothetical protein U5N85_00190 [Arcicella sp.]|nr:hypothetical protein [Arcicella sp.]
MNKAVRFGNDLFAVQTGYDLLVSVKPDDENTVFIGGTNIYRSSTSGFTSTTATTRIGGYNSAANMLCTQFTTLTNT